MFHHGLQQGVADGNGLGFQLLVGLSGGFHGRFANVWSWVMVSPALSDGNGLVEGGFEKSDQWVTSWVWFQEERPGGDVMWGSKRDW